MARPKSQLEVVVNRQSAPNLAPIEALYEDLVFDGCVAIGYD